MCTWSSLGSDQPSCWPLRCGGFFSCRSAVGEGTFVSRRCDLPVPVTHYLGCSVVMAVVHTDWPGAHQRMFSHLDTLQQRICHCVACVSSYVRNLLWYFLVTAMPHGKFGRLGRPATVCRRPGWGTRVTPGLHHWLLTSPVMVCHTATSWTFYVCRYRDSLTGYTRCDATWMQLVHVTLYAVLPCLRPVPFTDCVVASVSADKPTLDFCVC